MYHSDRCEKQSEEIEEVQFTLKENSREGLTGLHNLGNTCYMNSALQCLANCMPLTNYFVENRYRAEINETNTLGFKGVIARSYAKLLHSIWVEDKEAFAPTQFKKTVQRLNSMVSHMRQNNVSSKATNSTTPARS